MKFSLGGPTALVASLATLAAAVPHSIDARDVETRASSKGPGSNNGKYPVSYDQPYRPQVSPRASSPVQELIPPLPPGAPLTVGPLGPLLHPQYHYSPSSNFMNDPNGLVISGKPGNRTVHLYGQYNPTGMVAGNQHWLHATSKSFESYKWENQPIALAPENSNEAIFSGSSVIDANNTAGLFSDDTEAEDRIVAIYTLYTAEEQTQNLAFSEDGGYTFTKYSGNPVLRYPGKYQTQFRDPKVFWDSANQQWVMAIAHAQEYAVGFYVSKDLKDWTEASRYTLGGYLGVQYECPGLFQAPIVGGPRDGELGWILLISINPGAPMGGSVTQYVLGDWDGKTFTPQDSATRFADFAKDFYAAQTYDNAAEPGSDKVEPVIVGWASNWQYTQQAPTSPWRSVYTVPRSVSIQYTGLNPLFDDYVMAMQPISTREIQEKSLYAYTRSTKNKQAKAPTNQTIALDGNGGFDISITYSGTTAALKNATMDTFGELVLRAGSKKDKYNTLRVGFIATEQGGVYVDRRFAGEKWADSNRFFTDRFSTSVTPQSTSGEGDDERASYTLRLLVDRTISELFVNGGVHSATVLHFWDDEKIPDSLELRLGGDGILRVDDVSIKALKGTWGA